MVRIEEQSCCDASHWFVFCIDRVNPIAMHHRRSDEVSCSVYINIASPLEICGNITKSVNRIQRSETGHDKDRHKEERTTKEAKHDGK